MNQSLQNTGNWKPKGVLPPGASDLEQMPLFSGEKFHSLYFQSPGKEGLTLPSGEELMLLKETWVLLGRAWTWTAKSRKHPPCSPWKEFSFRSLRKGLLFLEFFVVVCFSLAFCFGLTVGMSLHPEGLIPHEAPGTKPSSKQRIARSQQNPGEAQRLRAACDLMKEHRFCAVAGWLIKGTPSYLCFATAGLTLPKKGSHGPRSQSRSVSASGWGSFPTSLLQPGSCMKAHLHCVPARSITIYRCSRAKRAPGSARLWGSV